MIFSPIQDSLTAPGPDDNRYHRTLLNLFAAHSIVNHQLNESVGKYGLTGQQYNLLRILRSEYPLSMCVGEIRSQMAEKMPDAPRLLSRLIKKGLITRCTNTVDRRASDVTISVQGLEVLAVLDTRFRISDLLRKYINDEQMLLLNDLLLRFITCPVPQETALTGA